MVVDGIYYALAFAAGGAAVAYAAGPAFGAPLLVLALFCLYFFRDPDRAIPDGPVAVAPADGKVVAIAPEPPERTRISIFLNIFDVHVNRSPVAGRIAQVDYRPGRFLVASREKASAENEQNAITVELGDGSVVLFKQIAGLIARRIVCSKKAGDPVRKGERVGMIKFGSRVDVLLGPEWAIAVKPGQRVSAGASVLARRRD